MKKFLIVLCLLGFCVNAFAAGVTYNFKPAHAAKIVEGTCYLYKNVETIDDLAWVDLGDGSTAPQIPKYTDAQWTKEVYRRIIIRDTKRGLTIKQRDLEQAVGVPDNAVESE